MADRLFRVLSVLLRQPPVETLDDAVLSQVPDQFPQFTVAIGQHREDLACFFAVSQPVVIFKSFGIFRIIFDNFRNVHV